MTKAILFVTPARIAALAILSLSSSLAAQDRLKTMPGYERYQRMAPLIRTAVGGTPLGFGGGKTSS